MFRNIFSKKGKVIAVGLKILQTLLIVMHIQYIVGLIIRQIRLQHDLKIIKNIAYT